MEEWSHPPLECHTKSCSSSLPFLAYPNSLFASCPWQFKVFFLIFYLLMRSIYHLEYHTLWALFSLIQKALAPLYINTIVYSLLRSFPSGFLTVFSEWATNLETHSVASPSPRNGIRPSDNMAATVGWIGESIAYLVSARNVRTGRNKNHHRAFRATLDSLCWDAGIRSAL